MIVNVNGAFFKKDGKPRELFINIEKEMTINEVVDILNIEHIGYAVFYINDRFATINDLVKDSDTLTILPLIDGG